MVLHGLSIEVGSSTHPASSDAESHNALACHIQKNRKKVWTLIYASQPLAESQKIYYFYRVAIAVWKNVITFAQGYLVFWHMSTQDIKTTIAEYFKTQPVLKAWLFGSFARGEETPDSDIDIIVEFDHSTPIGLFAYARMWRELKEKLGRDVDLVEDGTMRPLIAEDANFDRQLIYERAI